MCILAGLLTDIRRLCQKEENEHGLRLADLLYFLWPIANNGETSCQKVYAIFFSIHVTKQHGGECSVIIVEKKSSQQKNCHLKVFLQNL